MRDPEGWLGENVRAGLEERMRGGQSTSYLVVEGNLEFCVGVVKLTHFPFLVWAAEECLWVLVDMLQELASTLDLQFPLVLREGSVTSCECFHQSSF